MTKQHTVYLIEISEAILLLRRRLLCSATRIAKRGRGPRFALTVGKGNLSLGLSASPPPNGGVEPQPPEHDDGME